ncbi:MAG: beta-aspartyl-peptidase [Fusobacteriaceae bacterium]
MLLIKNAEVYSPEYLGKKDILVINDKIVEIKEKIENIENILEVKIIDATGKKIVPGFIDPHVHITGGGGEGSFKTRVPEIMLSKLTKAGITTVVGLLGTDGTTRSMENVVAKAKALTEEGITAYAYSGSYEIPTVTLTGSIRKDILYVSEIIGGKTAISDHRDSSPTKDEICRLASDIRVANMLSGKSGGLVLHVGSGKKRLKDIIEIIEETNIPIKIFRPTHVNREKQLVIDALELTKMGGIIDLTCGLYEELSPANILIMAKKIGANLENITISSDGYGSWSKYDKDGKLLKIGVSSVNSLHEELKKMVFEKKFDLSEVLKFFTSNTAKALGIFPQKGNIQKESDADFLILNKNLEIESVVAKGKMMIENTKILVKGTYED